MTPDSAAAGNDVGPAVGAMTEGSVAARLAYVIGRLNRLLGPGSGGLSHGQLTALASVAREGSLRMADLAQLELVSAPALTRVVAELESRGLVARSVDPADGRAFRIQITTDGTDAIQQARAARAVIVAGLLRDLNPAELAEIEQALPALEKVLRV
jgi:DNA-binding MarR family transcriptional regulator